MRRAPGSYSNNLIMSHSSAFLVPAPLCLKATRSENALRCKSPAPRARKNGMGVSMQTLGEDYPNGDDQTVQRMRQRLEGLFGVSESQATRSDSDVFDGVALRDVIRERWGVQYDVQPQKRHGRVYVQIMWRYFEQQSFYMDEDEFACHCEAVAQLLRQWNAVEYFCDYISTIKKKPVVGITVNIPIPGVDAKTAVFE